MLFLLASSLPFVLLLCKSLPLQSLPPWASDSRLLSLLLCLDLLSFLAHLRLSCVRAGARPITALASSMSRRNSRAPTRVENVEPTAGASSILDLPELALEGILERLTPVGLCNVAAVCSSLRERSCSDYLWERHMREKWGRLIGDAARRDWKLYLASAKHSESGLAVESKGSKGKKWVNLFSFLWPASWPKCGFNSGTKLSRPLPDDSIMCWYRLLESGKVWFPAQVYNREHGHVGFMLSCYDAEVRYDRATDTFHARYPPHGRRSSLQEQGVQWDRLRAPPVDAPAHVLHTSDCLSDLHPGDHVEIQWRKNKEFPYGWWYGVIGHLESCNGNKHFCHCHLSDTVILEFTQYTPGSRWRRTSLDRKYHAEEGNETDGFYGGIRKLDNQDEISKWRQFWPTNVFQ